MARIAGVDLPSEKRVEVALTYIFGIGPSTARKILETTKVDPDKRVKNLTDEEAARLRAEIEIELPGRGGAAHRGGDEHQAIDGHRLLSRIAASPQPSRAGSADAHERADPKGPEEDGGRRPQQAEAGQEGLETVQTRMEEL